MWIIPKPLHTSAYVQDMAALISDYQELSELCEQSLLVRSKPLPQKTWLRRWKRAGSMPHLSGRILKPSLGSDFATRWTSYQEASLVSHLAPQADEQETTTQDTFGHTSSKVSNDWADLPLFSSRMLRGSSQASSRATDGPILSERPFCSMSSESWSAWVIKRRREYSQRVKSVRPISENECSLWVSAPISATQDALLFQRCSAPQSEERWATPRATHHHAEDINRIRARKGVGIPLGTQVHLASQPTQPQEAQSSMSGSPQEPQWATPNTGSMERIVANCDYYKKRAEKGWQIDLHGQLMLDAQSPETTSKLNPRWVETLMGLPVGWTMPSCVTPWTTEQMSCACLEMESFPPQQSEPSESCGES